jgi:hypothetical protein
LVLRRCREGGRKGRRKTMKIGGKNGRERERERVKKKRRKWRDRHRRQANFMGLN